MSQLLARIELQLQSSVSAAHRAELLARKGSYLARVGRFEDARRIISELRHEFGDGRNGHVSAWIMLTEGVLHLFENLSPLALDRISRSQLLGLAMRDSSMVAIASAWKAHIEFETSKFEQMIKSIRLTIDHASDDDHGAHARVAMTISDSFLLCGDRTAAQDWFMKSRDHALKDGDQASIEALLYNRAAFGLASLRAQACFEGIDERLVDLVRLEVASAKNLQTLTGVAALTNFIHLCEARLLLLSKSYSEAIIALESARYLKPFADYNFHQRLVDLEVAYCLVQLDRTSEALPLVETLDLGEFKALDIDEQLIAAWLLHQLAVRGVRADISKTVHSQLDALTAEYRRFRENLSSMLDPFRPTLP